MYLSVTMFEEILGMGERVSSSCSVLGKVIQIQSIAKKWNEWLEGGVLTVMCSTESHQFEGRAKEMNIDYDSVSRSGG